MKKQLLKRLFAFIAMIFFISFLNAQCPGNKVQLCKSLRNGGCIYKCVSQGQVPKYLNQGWGYFCNCSFPFSQKTKSPAIIADKTEDSKTKQVASKKCPKVSCPPGYICIKGDCKRYFPFLTDGSPAKKAVSISSANSNAISFQLMETQNVSAKIYDATGRLVRTIADGRMPEGEQQITWNKSDEAGNTVSAGIYILRFNAGTFSDRKKFTVIK